MKLMYRNKKKIYGFKNVVNLKFSDLSLFNYQKITSYCLVNYLNCIQFFNKEMMKFKNGEPNQVFTRQR